MCLELSKLLFLERKVTKENLNLNAPPSGGAFLMPFVPSAEGKPPFPRKGDAIAVSGRAANGYPVKGGASVRKLGRRIVFWQSQNV